jgi:hypothetical protein
MRQTSRRITINFTNEDGFKDDEAIQALAGLLKGIEVGCGADFEAGTDYAEVTRLNNEIWVVVFRKVGENANTAIYSNAEKAAMAIYYGKHFQ